jgi:hypothetical protein
MLRMSRLCGCDALGALRRAETAITRTGNLSERGVFANHCTTQCAEQASEVTEGCSQLTERRLQHRDHIASDRGMT